MKRATNEIELPDDWRAQAFLNLSIEEAIAFLQSTGYTELSINAVIRDNTYGADKVLEAYKSMLIAYLNKKK